MIAGVIDQVALPARTAIELGAHGWSAATYNGLDGAPVRR
jgi:hypothetical protein